MDASASTRFKHNLTFSSTLLDEIYSETTRRKQSKSVDTNSAKSKNHCFNNNNNNNDDRQACLYQKLMQNKAVRETDRSPMRCKPIRTGVYQHDELLVKPKHEGKLVKTKSKALKIYNELKKVKQPISPGGRLSTFLNSLFTAGNNKKSKTSTATATCSSASSVSRSSCLAKTPSCRGKLINEVKKSVTFSIDGEAGSTSKRDNNRNICEAAARNLLKKVECEFDEDEDEKSDTSSDLFELDNLSPIHQIHSNHEELPIYATTNLHNNL